MTRAPVGEMLAGWRARRRCSQMSLAHRVGVSPRHLSFVETGRARPSPELVLALAEGLEVPLRERNALLIAAGHAPRYAHTPLDDAAMARVRTSLQRMLDAHSPYPGIVIDRAWNVVLANEAALALTSSVPAHLLGPPINVYRASLHPEGLAARTLDLDEWAGYLVSTLRRSVETTADDELTALLAEVESYPTVADIDPERLLPSDEPELLIPFRLDMDGAVLSLFTTLTTFGTPQDITLDELSVELFYPADDTTEALLRG